MIRFTNSTVAHIYDDMMELGCHPLVVSTVCDEIDKYPSRCQTVFLCRVENENIDDIARDMGVSHKTVQRIIHGKLACMASLLDASVQ